MRIVSIIVFFYASCGYSFEWLRDIKSNRPPQMSLQAYQEEGRYVGAQNFSDEIEISKFGGKFSIPLFTDEIHKWSFSSDLNYFNIDQRNKTQNSPIPGELIKNQNTLSYVRNKEPGKSYGGSFQVGSSSDEVYHSLDVTEFQANVFYYKECTEKSAWIFLINYSNLRSFLPNIPLPGVAYVYNQGRDLNLVLGFPFARFSSSFYEKWEFSYSALIPFSQHLRLIYKLAEGSEIYADFLYQPQLFKLKDNIDNEDRLIFDEKVVKLGYKIPVGNSASVDAYIGRTLNRRIFYAEGLTDSKDWVENIEDQTYFNVQFGLRF